MWVIYIRLRLFKSWIALSTGLITIQWINIRQSNCPIHWIVNYPVDSAIHLFNNWDQVNTAGGSDFFICVIDCCIFFIGKDGKDGQNGKF